MTATGPLSGLRILDLSSVVMGPLATQILGDLGADVMCVEPPRGDTNRRMGPGAIEGLSDVALNLLRNKRSLDIDLKDPRGRDAILRLGSTCDAVVTNLRPGPLRRLGLDYDAWREVRSDLVVCVATGFRSDSDDADVGAYDDVIQGYGGVASVVNLASGQPAFVPTLLADKVSGLTVAYAVMGALVHRARTGEGQLVEVAMSDAVSAFMMVEHSAGMASGGDDHGYARILTDDRRPARTTDGWIVVFPYLPAHWAALLEAGGESELIGDPRLSARRTPNPTFVYSTLARILARDSTAGWLALCREHGIPAARSRSLEEIWASWPDATHPHAGDFRVAPIPANYGATPGTVRRAAPLAGEHSRELLAEAGLSDGEIHDLIDSGVVRVRE